MAILWPKYQMAIVSKYQSQKFYDFQKKIYTRFSEAHFQAQLQSL